MISISLDARSAIARVGKIQATAYRNVRAAVVKSGEDVWRDWRTNATQTAGEHGKYYPDALQGRSTGPLAYEISPDPGMPQGDMSFEEGSRNQPPHLDGRRAFEGQKDAIQRRIRRAVESAL